MNRAFVLLISIAGFAATAAASPQANYPTRPIRWIVPFPAGSLLDIRSRFVAQHLTDALKQQVVVDDRPGAGGIIGTQLAANAPADGYTVALGTITTLVINPVLYRKLPYDPARDFTPVMLMVSGPLVVVVNPALPVNSIADLVALARAKPGELTYASIGNGSAQHITMELFKHLSNTDFRHIPYKETASAIGDLLSGRINVMFESQPAIEQHIKSGRLKALAVTEKKRSLGLPNVPTLNEAGIHDYEFSGWNGMITPAGTPPGIMTRLHDAVAHVLALPETAENFAMTGSRPGGGTSRDFAEFIGAEREKWGRVVTAAEIHID
jgi:tripartite-type tricarboxylate transporter receptor subunit TctC